MPEITHRGTTITEDSYKGISIDAARGVHAAVLNALFKRLQPGDRVVDLGAGRGALSMRLRDSGFEVVAFDQDVTECRANGIQCHEIDLDAGLSAVAEAGPFQAICAIEVIEHLENPREFLRKVISLARPRGAVVILSTPNPLDTFSCITMFTRGVFNWFSPQHYTGGGHISILPHWLLQEHLRYLDVEEQEWTFCAPWRHPNPLKQFIYQGIVTARRVATHDQGGSYFEGQTALLVAMPRQRL